MCSVAKGALTLGMHDVLKAHFLIADFFFAEGEGIGGVGPRDLDLLHSALYRQHVTLGGTAKWDTKFDVCATLLYGLIKDHPFHDANKRTAFLSAGTGDMPHPRRRYSDRYTDAEQAARSNRAGMWQWSFDKPWDWRAGVLQEAAGKDKGADGCIIKGNISRRGERIYHMPFQQHYGRTKIDENKGERWFCNEKEAQAAGWRRALQ
jgi:hypothetical protein